MVLIISTIYLHAFFTLLVQDEWRKRLNEHVLKMKKEENWIRLDWTDKEMEKDYGGDDGGLLR